MKTLLTVLAFVSITGTAKANLVKAPEYYSANFTITNIAPICPRPLPGQMTCMAMGSHVTLSATLGCADTLLFTEVQEVKFPGLNNSEIHVASVVRKHPKSDVIRCYRAQVVTKTITVMGPVDRDVVNAVIDPTMTTF